MLDSKIRDNKSNSIYETLIPKIKFDKDYRNFINYIYKNTYNIENMGKVWNKSHNTSYILYRYFINDKIGIKTFFYKIVDIFNKSKFKLHQNAFRLNKFDERILNKDKNTWHHPRFRDQVYDYNFEELYNYSLTICIKMNALIYDVLHNKKDINTLLDYIEKIKIQNIQELLH